MKSHVCSNPAKFLTDLGFKQDYEVVMRGKRYVTRQIEIAIYKVLTFNVGSKHRADMNLVAVRGNTDSQSSFTMLITKQLQIKWQICIFLTVTRRTFISNTRDFVTRIVDYIYPSF